MDRPLQSEKQWSRGEGASGWLKPTSSSTSLPPHSSIGRRHWLEKVAKKYQPVSAISIKAIPSPLSHDQKMVHMQFADIWNIQWGEHGEHLLWKRMFSFGHCPNYLSVTVTCWKRVNKSPPHARKKTFFYRRCSLNFIVYAYTFFLGNCNYFWSPLDCTQNAYDIVSKAQLTESCWQ